MAEDRGKSGWPTWLASLGTAAAIPAAILAGRPLSSLLIVSAVIIAIPISVWGVIRTSRWDRIIAHKKAVTLGSSLLVPLVLLGTLISPGWRNFFVYDLMGFREPVNPDTEPANQPTVSSVDLFLRQGQGATRVDVVIRNDTARKEVVTEIAVDVEISDGVMCSDYFLHEYALGDSIDVAIDSGEAKFVGEVVELGSNEFQLPVDGSLNEVCGFTSYDFVFRPIVELAPNDVSTLAIELPSQFEARRIELHEGDIESTEAALDKTHTIDVRLPTNTLSDTAARIMVTVNLSDLPSPEQLCRIEGNTDLRDGLRPCPD